MKDKYDSIQSLINGIVFDNEYEQNNGLNVINKVSTKLVDSLPRSDIYQILGEGIHELIPDSIVMVNSFDNSSGLFQLKTVIGINRYLDSIIRVLSKSPIGMTFTIDDKARNGLGDGNLKKVPGGIYELAMGSFSEETSKLLNKILDVEEVFAVGINLKGRLYGSIGILLHRTSNDLNEGTLKVLINLASISLQRYQSEEALKASHSKIREFLQIFDRVLQNSTDMIFTVDLTGRFLFTNQAFYTQLGYSEKELKETNCFQSVHPLDLDHVKLQLDLLAEGKSIENIQFRYRKKDGSYINVLDSACPLFNDDKKVIGAIGIARNITDIKKSELELRGHKNTLEKLLENKNSELQKLNGDLVRELDERKRMETELRNASEQLKNLMETAPVLIAQSDLKTRITYVNKKFEEETGYTREEAIGQYWTTAGVIPPEFVGKMLKRTVERVAGRPADGMEVPLKCKNGEIKYFKGVGQIIKEDDKPVAVQVLAYDITKPKQIKEYEAESSKRLIKTLEDMVDAMVIAMEMKDPYTAGHQKRVAQLAYAIAVDIGLTEGQLVGIKLAGLVHDIGKICVPSEILSYPGKLSEAQMSIIKMHPSVGYEILKKIDFHWPIARAVQQHHERLDGSGYPFGLTGENISLEAKILAVADVVEAMVSHRPYRPAQGLSSALKEIKNNAGCLYDNNIVDSCFKIISDRGFKFEEGEIEIPPYPDLTDT